MLDDALTAVDNPMSIYSPPDLPQGLGRGSVLGGVPGIVLLPTELEFPP
jgi:hypothetical protein